MESQRIIIENVQPTIDCGEYPVKRVVGEEVRVTADIFSHGVERLSAILRYRKIGESGWSSAKMSAGDNDSWSATFQPDSVGEYEFIIEAWLDRFSLWLNSVEKWEKAGEDVSRDIQDGLDLIRQLCRPSGEAKMKLDSLLDRVMQKSDEEAIKYLATSEVKNFIESYWEKEGSTVTGISYKVIVDPNSASYSSWYEIFPRSQGSDARKSGTFVDCEGRLQDIKEMGFNVLYLTPIHPIGHTNRRGKNGARTAKPSDPGSPWAIGNEQGGHKSINPDLGTISDFVRLVKKARTLGIEVAIDIALQCSPDHPYVRDHPEWFYRRRDGTIRYAENPPKRYYDIYPINFDTQDREALWVELKSVFQYWIDKGVRIFRVDNPHTKPFPFWKWVIREIKKKDPGITFLAEAFTRPKVMYELSKLGFSQSYSYFAWKNYHYEIIDYFNEINSYPVREHFRPVLFVNTPDILTENLQLNGRPAFMYRAFLAATLSPSWGIYSGYELIENSAVKGTEEYFDSEKYEIKKRNWFATGNIRSYIAKLNDARSKLKPLQKYRNLRFLNSDNPNIIAFERRFESESVVMVVNINPSETHLATVTLPDDSPLASKSGTNTLTDLMTGSKLTFYGLGVSVTLKPAYVPGMILVGGEHGER